MNHTLPMISSACKVGLVVSQMSTSTQNAESHYEELDNYIENGYIDS
jgi:hypothetical protein